jgi:GNAT superfamily N-acetyltransferase
VIRDMGDGDMEWAEQLIGSDFGGRWQARKGELVDALGHRGLVAVDNADPSVRAGLLTYWADDEQVEIVTFQAVERHRGAGSALLQRLVELAGGRRVWLITTNDNLDALRFYQRRGFVMSGLFPGAADRARASLKPTIPAVGDYGIAVRDEIELTYLPR